MKYNILLIDDYYKAWDLPHQTISCKPYSYVQLFDMDDQLLRLIYREQLLQEFISKNSDSYMYQQIEKL